MITVDEMRHLEELSVEHGVTKLQLMENAGFGLKNYLKRDFSLSGKKILIICLKIPLYMFYLLYHSLDQLTQYYSLSHI